RARSTGGQEGGSMSEERREQGFAPRARKRMTRPLLRRVVAVAFIIPATTVSACHAFPVPPLYAAKAIRPTVVDATAGSPIESTDGPAGIGDQLLDRDRRGSLRCHPGVAVERDGDQDRAISGDAGGVVSSHRVRVTRCPLARREIRPHLLPGPGRRAGLFHA